MIRIAVVAFAFLLVTAAAAGARTVHVEFRYNGVADGFRLYRNGALVCEVGGGVRAFDCVIATVGRKDEYTLAAVVSGPIVSHSCMPSTL